VAISCTREQFANFPYLGNIFDQQGGVIWRTNELPVSQTIATCAIKL
jgi:hypothetical protein